MRICVIFNPTAKGDKARHFRRHLNDFGAGCFLKPTPAAGAGRQLAAQAVAEGFDCIVAAGGDGTVFEVLNGIGDAPDGFARSRLGILPLGTVNVFARELGLPLKLRKAWSVVEAGRETRVDLPSVEFRCDGRIERRFFAQLAGAGLDARAVELTDWNLKKKAGVLAYIWAGLKALRETQPRITITAPGHQSHGELVLLGNGRFYGGSFRLFPKADLRDGRIDARIFPRANLRTALACGWGIVTGRFDRPGGSDILQTESLSLESNVRVPLELDGEWVGELPATFRVQREALRVIAP